MATITHSNDAGRYGGSKSSDMVRNFIKNVSLIGQAVDRQYTDQNVLVELTYIPGNMLFAERYTLLAELLAFAENQQSWHNDWFLWNLVTVADGTQSIRLAIS